MSVVFNLPPPEMPATPQGGSEGGSTTSAASGGGSGGVTAFNDFKGRDPDLIRTGETLKVPGGTHVVKDGESLSSIAAKYGTTVDKLIELNGMDASLMGRNGPGGAYFNSGPVPRPGSAVTTSSGAAYTKSDVPKLREDVDKLFDAAKISAEEHKTYIKIIEKLESGETLSADDVKNLDEIKVKIAAMPLTA